MTYKKTLCKMRAEFDELLDKINPIDLSSPSIVERARKIEEILSAKK